MVSKIQLRFFKVTGENQLNPNKPIGIAGIMTFHSYHTGQEDVSIHYHETDTLSDIVLKINRSGANIVAYINHRQNLVLKARLDADHTDSKTNFMIRHLEDSGELLVGHAGILYNSGTNGAFNYRRVNEIQKLRSTLDNITFTPDNNPAYFFKLHSAIENNVGLIATATPSFNNRSTEINLSNGLKDGSNAVTHCTGS